MGSSLEVESATLGSEPSKAVARRGGLPLADTITFSAPLETLARDDVRAVNSVSHADARVVRAAAILGPSLTIGAICAPGAQGLGPAHRARHATVKSAVEFCGFHSCVVPTMRDDSEALAGPLLALSPFIMQIKDKMLKWIAGSVLVATTAGVLSGCYVETRPRHHYYSRPAVIVR